MSEILFALLQLQALLVISLGGGYEVSLSWALDGKLVGIIVRAARVHRLHHVVPQVFAHLETEVEFVTAITAGGSVKFLPVV